MTPPVSIAVLPAAPIASMRRYRQEPAGTWTVADVVEATALEPDALTVSLDGQVIEPEAWGATVPEPGASLIVRHRPRAGVAVTAASAALFTGGSQYIRQYLTNSLTTAIQGTPPPDADAPAAGIRRTISGNRNDFEAYGTMPQVLGKHRFYPPLAARSYTMVEGGKLIQYALFTFGFGKLALSELKIGDEPLFKSTTSIVYTGVMHADADAFGGSANATASKATVSLELRQGTATDTAITLFANDVQEDIVGKVLTLSRGWIIRTTIPNATRITVIVGCPSGLIWRRDSGTTKSRTVRMRVEYRAVGASTWLSTDTNGNAITRIKMTDKTLSSVYAQRSWPVSSGTYEVRVKRSTSAAGDPGITDQTVWSSMLVGRDGTVTNPSNLCRVAARIQITNRFPNLVSDFNAVAQTDVLNYDNGASWVQGLTSSPAALFRHVLQGDANKRAVADARINLTALAAWADECNTEGFEFNSVTQGRSTVPDTLERICAAGRARLAIQDGLFTVIRENDLSGAPVQHFTPRNTTSFRSERRYVSLPEALKVTFVDTSAEANWLDSERIVPDDGYTVATASTYERLDLAGITDADQAYKLGRYEIAKARLRPEAYTFGVDFEHLDALRGDWVKAQHDVILVGLAAGRVISTTVNGGGDVLTATLDQECPMAAASYACRFRKSADGATIYALVDTDAGNQTTITFTTPIDSASVPIAGDLFLFGEAASESIDLVVDAIDPLDELTAQVVCVDAAPAVLTADDGVIPAYDSQITIPPRILPGPGKRPRVLDASSTDTRDEDGRGPVLRRGARLRFQGGGSRAR